MRTTSGRQMIEFVQGQHSEKGARMSGNTEGGVNMHLLTRLVRYDCRLLLLYKLERIQCGRELVGLQPSNLRLRLKNVRVR